MTILCRSAPLFLVCWFPRCMRLVIGAFRVRPSEGFDLFVGRMRMP